MAKLRKTIVEEKKEQLIPLVNYKMALLHIPNYEVLAQRLNMCGRALYNRIHRPELFRYDQLLLLFQALQFTEEEKRKVI